MSDAEIIAAIRERHLKANVGFYEAHPRWFAVEWNDSHVDGLGGAPYLHVPIGARNRIGDSYIGPHGIVVRVYPPARLGKRFIARCGYRWGSKWRSEPGIPPNWPVRSGSSGLATTETKQ